MRKLFDLASYDRPRANQVLPHSYRGRPDFCLGLFFGRRGRENQRQPVPAIRYLRKTHSNELSVLSFTNHEKPSGWPRTSEILKMNLTLSWFLSLPLNLANIELGYSTHTQLEMPRLSKHGNPERGFVENNFGTTSVSHGDQSFPQQFYNGNVQVYNYSALLHDSNFHLIVVP